MRAFLLSAVTAACLGFTAAPASAQLFRRAQSCPTCPNGQCGQPQLSAPLFLPLPAQPPQALPAVRTTECPCTAKNCTAVVGLPSTPCPCTALNCVCNTPALARSPAAACSPAPAAAFVGSDVWYPGVRVVNAVKGRPRLFRRTNGCS